MFRKSKIFIITIVFILQMVMFSEVFVSTSYAALETIAQDDFSTGNFTGGSGWIEPWTTSGNVNILTYNYYSYKYCAQLSSKGSSLTRTVDLKGWDKPTLTYYWRASSFGIGDEAYVIVDDGEENIVHTITLLNNSLIYSKKTIDLSSFNMSGNLKIKFVIKNNVMLSSYLYIDDIEITGYKDDYGSSIAAAEPITVNSAINGEITYADDYDYFKFTTDQAGLYTIETTGSTNTYGYLYNASGTLISENDDKDSSSNTNFYIMENLSANATYYVGVKHHSPTGMGKYVLKVEGPKSAIFFDGFESRNYTAGGWINNSADISGSYKYNGNYSSELNSSDSITKSISTEGYENIVVSYAFKSRTILNSAKLICAWTSNGTTWTILESVSGTNDWGFRSFSLPVDASNNPNFRIKFYTSGYTFLDEGYIDNVLISGTQAIGQLKVEFYNSQRDSSTNIIYQNFRVTNSGSSSVNLSTVKLRYYYTIDYERSQNFYCDWSTVGAGNITGSFIRYDILHDNADYYLEIGFTSGAGNLAPGSSVEVKSRIAKTDWSNYQQANDYSFNVSASDYSEWNYVTAFINGSLVWGIPPEETPTPNTEGLKVEFYNTDINNPSNSIYQRFRVTNIGNSYVDLSTVKLRYYYTIDSENSQNFWCDWSTVGNGNVTGTFMKYVTPYTNADYYLEIGFTSGAGNLAPGSSIEVASRIAKTDWSNYMQTNDYSFNASASNYLEWNYVTAYINTTLVWGIPPGGTAPTPTPTPTLTPTATPTSTPTPTITPTPTAIRTPGPSQTPGLGIGLRGEYYDNMDFTDIKLIRIDSQIDFVWGEDSPSSEIDSDTFSVRWIGKVQPLYSEQYIFYTITDGATRVWVDGVLLVDNAAQDTMTEDFGTIDLEAGVKYDIKIEYCENSSDATAILMWSSESQEKEVVPQTQLYPPRLFTALEHKVRTVGNNFAIGDYVPLMLKIQIMWPMDNPVVSVDMNIRKQDGTTSGFILNEILTGTNINKNMFKIYVNGLSIAPTDFSVWSEGQQPDKKLKIRVLRSFSQNDELQVYYTVKATATSTVFNTGIKEYLDNNGLNNINMNIFYEISERIDLELLIKDTYSKNSTRDLNEKLKFQAEIKLEDPILLE